MCLAFYAFFYTSCWNQHNTFFVRFFNTSPLRVWRTHVNGLGVCIRCIVVVLSSTWGSRLDYCRFLCCTERNPTTSFSQPYTDKYSCLIFIHVFKAWNNTSLLHRFLSVYIIIKTTYSLIRILEGGSCPPLLLLLGKQKKWKHLCGWNISVQGCSTSLVWHPV